MQDNLQMTVHSTGAALGLPAQQQDHRIYNNRLLLVPIKYSGFDASEAGNFLVGLRDMQYSCNSFLAECAVQCEHKRSHTGTQCCATFLFKLITSSS